MNRLQFYEANRKKIDLRIELQDQKIVIQEPSNEKSCSH